MSRRISVAAANKLVGVRVALSHDECWKGRIVGTSIVPDGSVMLQVQWDGSDSPGTLVRPYFLELQK